jgi:hypothetical protein
MTFIDASKIIELSLTAGEQETRDKKSILVNESVYVDQWETWVTVRELTGTERGEYLGQCMDQKGKVNFKKLNPYMVILCTRYPDPHFPPPEDAPHRGEFPGLKNEQGEYITDPHPKRSDLMFKIDHMGILNKGSGAALEKVAQVAGRLSALRPEDVEKKDETSGTDDWENSSSAIE